MQLPSGAPHPCREALRGPAREPAKRCGSLGAWRFRRRVSIYLLQRIYPLLYLHLSRIGNLAHFVAGAGCTAIGSCCESARRACRSRAAREGRPALVQRRGSREERYHFETHSGPILMLRRAFLPVSQTSHRQKATGELTNEGQPRRKNCAAVPIFTMPGHRNNHKRTQ